MIVMDVVFMPDVISIDILEVSTALLRRCERQKDKKTLRELVTKLVVYNSGCIQYNIAITI